MKPSDCPHDDVRLTYPMVVEVVFHASANDNDSLTVRDVADEPADVDLDDNYGLHAPNGHVWAVCQDCDAEWEYLDVDGIEEVPNLWPQICDRILRGSDYEVVEADDDPEPDAWELLERLNARYEYVRLDPYQGDRWKVLACTAYETFKKLADAPTPEAAIRKAWDYAAEKEGL